MSVATTQLMVQYLGNGSASIPYPIPFPFFDEAWIKVRTLDPVGNETRLALNTDYSVTGAGDPAGELITALPYAASHQITISREVPITQLLELLYNDRLPAAQLEQSLDKLTFIAQQLAGGNATGDRSIRFPYSEPSGNRTLLPTPKLRRDSVVAFGPVTGEMEILRIDQLAQRLLVILGAEAVLPYRTREVTGSFTVAQEDVNTSIRVNAAAPSLITLPQTTDFSDNFFCTVSKFGAGAVAFSTPPGVILESEGGKTRIFSGKVPVGIQLIGINRWWIFGDLY